jgi:type IV pilus assembly protein PilM
VSESQSIWKKEITLRRKPKAEKAKAEVVREHEPVPAPAEANAVAADTSPKASVWKKEISLRRKPKAEKPKRASKQAAVPVPADVTAVAADTSPKVPVWKKEISLRRKPKAEKPKRESKQASAPVPADVTAVAAATSPKVPWWKKELTLSHKPKAAVERRAPVARVFAETVRQVPEPEPVAVTESIVELEPAPIAEVEPVVAPVVAPAPVVDQVERPLPVLPPLPPEAEVVYEPSFPSWEDDEPLPLPVPAPEPLPEIGPEPELDPAAVEEPTVVAAVAPTPVADAEPKVPWWKKEISLGGKRAPKRHTPRSYGAKTKKLRKPAVRRELSLPRLSLPKLSLPARGGGHPRAKGGDTKLKRVVGLKIGASQIAAASVANNGHAELLQVAREPIEAGVVVGGELRDPAALAESLRGFFARHKLPKKNVRLGIASSRIGVRTFDVSGIEDDKALANAIQFRAQEVLPIPLDEAVLDYRVLGESIGPDGERVRRVLLVVAYRELVERYATACRDAGIQLVGIDLEAFALLRALGSPRPEDVDPTAATVAVAIGHERSTFAVTDGRVCEFTRVLEWGGSSLNVALARALDRAPNEVEAVKRSLSLDEGGPLPDGMTAADAELAVAAVRTQVQSFARELVSSLQFYQHQPGSLGIGEIVLTGGTAHMSGLAAELQRLIGVPVRVGDPLGRVRITKKVSAAEQVGSLAVAIGLGIED